jgi:hypothetical protein
MLGACAEDRRADTDDTRGDETAAQGDRSGDANDVDDGDGDDGDAADQPFHSPVAVIVGGVAIEGDSLEFGSASSEAPTDRTVVLRPLEPGPVEIFSQPPVIVAGRDIESWALLTQPPSTLPAEGGEFTVRFAPHRGGELEGALVIAFGRRSDERLVVSLRGVGEEPTREPGLRTNVYDDSFDALPDFNALTPTATFQSPTIDISARAGTEFFAFLFRGQIEIPVGGRWTFAATSDDGSRLLIDGTVVVNNDGLHGPITVEGQKELAAGLHDLEVQFFEKTGGDVLTVTWSGPGIAPSSIPASALSSTP